MHGSAFAYEELAVEPLLIVLIAVLSAVICALAGFWFYRASQEHRHRIKPPRGAQRAAKDDLWENAVRAFGKKG